MRLPSALVLLSVVVLGCAGAGSPTPIIIYVTPSPEASAAVSVAPSTPPAVPSTPDATQPPLTPLFGQAGVTEAMTRPGSLGLTIPGFVKRWNRVLDQGQYPIKRAPELDGQTFTISPKGADSTILVGVVNDDGTIRSINAISIAGGIPDEIDRLFAQLEALVIWSTLGPAANPRLSEAEDNLLLTNMGIPDAADFGTLPSLVLDQKGVRYHIIEGDSSTNFIARAAK